MEKELTTAERGLRKTRIGRVVSDKMTKSIVVSTETSAAHRQYGKITRRSNRFMAHDERNEAKVGDLVRIVETRPMSARKRWRLVEIVERAK
jgi:small subunit ribosomal protein S17